MKSTCKTTHTCAECHRPIINVFEWQGRELGIECWKKIALPEIIKERELRDEQRKQAWMFKCQMIANTLKGKDLSKITNSFKLEFIPSIIAQVEAGRMLSKRQIEIARSFFNTADHLRYMVFEFIADGDLDGFAQADYNQSWNGKLVKIAKEILGDEYPQQQEVSRWME